MHTPQLVTQKDMSKSLKKYAKDTCYHGYAGLASAFVALAHSKLKPGGVLALVLPLAAAAGQSWQEFRKMIAGDYSGLTVLSLSAPNDEDLSFSADTGLAECLVIARKIAQDELPDGRGRFASLNRKPHGFAHAGSLSVGMRDNGQSRGIEDGPYGGVQLSLGSELAGVTIDAPHNGEGWGAVRLSDCSVAQTVYALSQSKLWLPGESEPRELIVANLSDVGRRGWHDMNIVGSKAPFLKKPPSPTSTYPALWNHNARLETRMVCEPDSQLVVKTGMEGKAAVAWATASHAHINRDFRFTSQPLTVAFTERASIGGTAWPNVKFSDGRFDYAFAVWGNCTLGIMSFWWHSSRQTAGRGRITVSGLDSLPILDLRCLSDEQLLMAEMTFDEFRDKHLMPVYLADVDPNRALLDRRVICDLLDFDEKTYEAVRRLAQKWCAEPSVHGGKNRPKDAELAV